MAIFLLKRSITINMKLYSSVKLKQVLHYQKQRKLQHPKLWYSSLSFDSSKGNVKSINGKEILSNDKIINTYENRAIQEQQENWQAIYRFPLIGIISAYNRLKKSYTIFNAIIIPYACILEYTAVLPSSYAALTSIIGITSWLTLVLTSLLAKNLIGFIYINDAGNKIKLAYVDYWGKRHDIIAELDDMKIQTSKLQLCKTLFVHDSKYILMHRHGTFLDHYLFVNLFGHTED